MSLSTSPMRMQKIELGKVMYYSADRNVLYTMVGGTLYEYDVEKGLE